jgi:hypothetical protein
MKAKGKPEKTSDDLLAAPFLVEHFLTHIWPDEDEATGEVKYVPRVVLIAPNGTMAASSSIEALKSLKDLCQQQIYGEPPWVGGHMLQLVSSKSRKGRTVHRFVIPGINLEGEDTDGKSKHRKG